MKNIKIIFVFILGIFFISTCQTNNESTTSPNPSNGDEKSYYACLKVSSTDVSQAGYDFSTSQIGNGDDTVFPGLDMRVEPWYSSGLPDPNFQSYDGLTPTIKDMGAVSMDDVTVTPQSGYSADASVFTGHSYVVITKELNHAVLYVESVQYENSNPDDYPVTICFTWKYLSN